MIEEYIISYLQIQFPRKIILLSQIDHHGSPEGDDDGHHGHGQEQLGARARLFRLGWFVFGLGQFPFLHQ